MSADAREMLVHADGGAVRPKRVPIDVPERPTNAITEWAQEVDTAIQEGLSGGYDGPDKFGRAGMRAIYDGVVKTPLRGGYEAGLIVQDLVGLPAPGHEGAAAKAWEKTKDGFRAVKKQLAKGGAQNAKDLKEWGTKQVEKAKEDPWGTAGYGAGGLVIGVKGVDDVFGKTPGGGASVPAVKPAPKTLAVIEGKATPEPKTKGKAAPTLPAPKPEPKPAAAACTTCITEGQARVMETQLAKHTGRRSHHSRDDFENGPSEPAKATAFEATRAADGTITLARDADGKIVFPKKPPPGTRPHDDVIAGGRTLRADEIWPKEVGPYGMVVHGEGPATVARGELFPGGPKVFHTPEIPYPPSASNTLKRIERVEIEITRDQLDKTSRMLSGDADPGPMRERLSSYLDRGESRVPLADLFPDSARKLNNTQTGVVDAGNCFEATWSWDGVTRGRALSTAEMEGIRKDYRPVAPGDPGQWGDVMLVYTDDGLQHAARVVTPGPDGLVFTKQNKLEWSPYTVETRATTVDTFADQKGYRVEILRKNPEPSGIGGVQSSSKHAPANSTPMSPSAHALGALRTTTQGVFDVGPNEWVSTGNNATGTVVLRGLTGNTKLGNPWEDGIWEAKRVLDGDSSDRLHVTAVLDETRVSEATSNVTSWYNDPLAIQARVPNHILEEGLGREAGERVATRAIAPEEVNCDRGIYARPALRQASGSIGLSNICRRRSASGSPQRPALVAQDLPRNCAMPSIQRNSARTRGMGMVAPFSMPKR